MNTHKLPDFSRYFAFRWFRMVGLYILGLTACFLFNWLLFATLYPFEYRLAELATFPIALLVIGTPILTAIWFVRGLQEWITVLDGQVKSVVFEDGQQYLHLYDCRTWAPPRVSGELFRLDPPAQVALQRNVLGRWRLSYRQEGSLKQITFN